MLYICGITLESFNMYFISVGELMMGFKTRKTRHKGYSVENEIITTNLRVDVFRG